MRHIKNPASHSLGLRRSCVSNRNIKPTTQENTSPWTTAMREAFINGNIRRSTGAAIINQCARALKHGAGVVNIGKGWNAHLSLKTYTQLKAEGIMP